MFGKLRERVNRIAETRAYQSDVSQLKSEYYELRRDFNCLLDYLKLETRVIPQHREFISTAPKEDHSR